MVLVPPPSTDDRHRQSYAHEYKHVVHLCRARRSPASGVVLLAAPDVDAVCASKILIDLFKIDGVLHTVKVVDGYRELERIREELAVDPDVHTVFLLNLGSLLSLPIDFPLPAGVSVHLIDANRPWNLSNVWGGVGGGPEQGTRVLTWDDGDKPAAEMDELRRSWESLEYDPDSDEDESEDESEEEEDEEDEDEDEGGSPRPRKRRRSEKEARAAAREERNIHRARLDKYYQSGTSQGIASAYVIYMLALELERCTNDLAWLAILGTTWQYLTSRISRAKYDVRYTHLSDEVARLNPPLPASVNTSANPDDFSIRATEEMRFPLLRHWSLYDSMLHSHYVAGKLGIWKEGGRKQMHGLLAEMGVPLSQAQQSYSHMDTDLKRSLHAKVDSIAPRHSLLELSYPSFIRHFGLRSQPLAAADAVEAVDALLQAATGVHLMVEIEGGRGGGEWFGGTRAWGVVAGGEVGGKENRAPPGGAQDGEEEEAEGKKEDRLWERNFWIAYDAIRNDITDLRHTIPLCIALHRALLRQGAYLIDNRAIRNFSTFRLAIIREGPDLALFAHPAPLSRLAAWLVEALRDRILGKRFLDGQDAGARRAMRELPFVVACLDERTSTYVVAGVTGSALFGDVRKNKLGIAFHEAAEATRSRTRHDRFDASIVEVHADDLMTFVEGVQDGLAVSQRR